ncbi:MAG: radical SAM protein [Verrucomicrobiales bacterium]|nr:radical SAM protein [Verrucomicrobiales bacterium]
MAASNRWETAFGYARDFLDNRFVYVVISPRAHGLSVGINMNPDRLCNYDCVYCEVDRTSPIRARELDVPVMIEELKRTLAMARDNRLRARPGLASLPEELLVPRHVALSGDGEPTISPKFAPALEALAHLRALEELPFFKIVLVSNGTAIDHPPVWRALQTLTNQDEVWLKLDGGTAAYLEHINRPTVPLERVLKNILLLGRHRPVVIQSLFARFERQEPEEAEIEAYVDRLVELQNGGAQISLVQIYSAMRPTMLPDCGHLPLRTLSRIAHLVRDRTGLRVHVF